MIAEGNFLMEPSHAAEPLPLGSYGLLNAGELTPAPLLVLDGGVELRQNERYDFSNDNRADYHGYLFQYTLAGTGFWQGGGRTLPLPPGTAFLVAFPEESRYFLPPGASWQFIYLHFDGFAAAGFVQKLQNRYGPVFSLPPSCPPIRALLAFQRRLLCAAPEKYEGADFLCHFLCLLLRALEAPAGQPGLVAQAVRRMEEQYATLPGIDALAGQLGVSPAHLSRQFKAQTGVSPIRRLGEIRLQHAMNDLLNTDAPMDVIARRNGFSGGNYFCKIFVKAVGITPTNYRKRGPPV